MHYEAHLTVVPLLFCVSELKFLLAFCCHVVYVQNSVLQKPIYCETLNANQSGLATYLRWEHNDSQPLLLNSM